MVASALKTAGPCRLALLALLLATSLVALSPRTSAARTWHVPGDQPTIWAAILAAVDGDEILIAPGTYTGPDNRRLNLLGKSVAIRSEAGADVTIIDCEYEDYGISTDFGTIEIVGLTIQHASGSGIECLDNTSAVIRDCIVRECRGEIRAGGMYLADHFEVTGCKVQDCVVDGGPHRGCGGGIYVYSASSSTISDCEITGCVAINGDLGDAQGGGIFCSDFFGFDLVIRHCRIEGNASDEWGGGICTSSEGLQIEDCLIVGNHAGSGGGGVAAWGSPSLTGTTISGNRTGGGAHSDAGGGGIYNSRALTVENCIIWGNCAASGEDIFLSDPGSLRLTCCDFDPGHIAGNHQWTADPTCFTADPLFCDPIGCASAPIVGGDYTLDARSRCLAENSPCEAQIGALGEGCSSPTPTKATTWGRIKAGYR